MGAVKEYIARLKGIEGDSLRLLFRNFSDELEPVCRLFHLDEGAILLRAQDEATHVYLLLSGSARAIDEMESGGVYSFARFTAPAFFGEYETFGDFPHYRGTLVCAEPCTLVSIPRRTYLVWLRRDAEALLSRTQQVVRQLVAQAGTERSYLFLTGLERISVYFCSAWEKHNELGSLRLSIPRQQLADETGLSIKTVQRALLRLRREGIVSSQGRSLVIDETQYHRLRLLCREVLP